MKTEIKESGGKVIGYFLDTESRITLQTITGKTLGWYTKRFDQTFKSNGSLVGNGNQLMLICEK